MKKIITLVILILIYITSYTQGWWNNQKVMSPRIFNDTVQFNDVIIINDTIRYSGMSPNELLYLNNDTNMLSFANINSSQIIMDRDISLATSWDALLISSPTLNERTYSFVGFTQTGMDFDGTDTTIFFTLQGSNNRLFLINKDSSTFEKVTYFENGIYTNSLDSQTDSMNIISITRFQRQVFAELEVITQTGSTDTIDFMQTSHIVRYDMIGSAVSLTVLNVRAGSSPSLIIHQSGTGATVTPVGWGTNRSTGSLGTTNDAKYIIEFFNDGEENFYFINEP